MNLLEGVALNRDQIINDEKSKIVAKENLETKIVMTLNHHLAGGNILEFSFFAGTRRPFWAVQMNRF